MKKLFLLLTCLLAGLNTFAQISILTTDMPTVPSVVYNGVDTAAIPVGTTAGLAGANRTWNFSGATREKTDTVRHVLPSTTQYASNFPTATDAATPNNVNYAFFRNTSTAFICQGLAGDFLNNGTTLSVNFSPTFDAYRFPTNYGNNFTGTYGFVKKVKGSDVGQAVDSVRLTFTSTYFDTIDGWGTVVTPVGSYNALRQVRKEFSRTIVDIKLIPFISPWSNVSDTRDTTITYTWLAKETKGPVLTLGRDSLDNFNRITWSLTPPLVLPVADFTATNPYGGFVQFTNTSINNPTSYSWTFGDGGTSTATTPTHTYAANSTYNVCLIATNAAGSDTTCKNVVVSGIFTTAITGPTQLCNDARTGIPYSATLRAGNTYSWTPTGGNVTTGAGTSSVTVNWNAGGSYNLRLIECNSTGQFCDTANLAVTVKPVATSTQNQTICFGQSFQGHNASGTYVDTLTAANGCDSIYTLNLTVRPRNTTTVTISLCAGSTYAGHTTSGTYTDTYPDQFSCDSIRTLNLTIRPANTSTVNASICPGSNYAGHTASGTYIDHYNDQYGCDSTRTLNLTVNANITDTLDLAICNGTSYYGYTTPGTYLDTFSSGGCDSIRVLNLSVVNAIFDTITSTICSGDTLYGYTQAGTYTDTYTSSGGCDSTRRLVLSVTNGVTSTITRTICFGDNVEGYTASGTYVDVFPAANGCDSTRTLNLTVRPENATSVTQVICPGDSYEGYSASGVYTDVFAGANTCDSTRTLFLTVKLPNTVTINHSICQGGSFQGYTAAGTYVDTLTDATNCDSIRTINLTVLQVISSTVNKSICTGQTWEGYSASGTYVDTLSASGGCDSIRTLVLSVVSQILVNTDVEICTGESYFAGGAQQTLGGTYIDSLSATGGCDSIVTTILTVNPVPTVVVTQTGFDLAADTAGATGFQWFLDGDTIPGANGSTHTAAATGDYTVAVTNVFNCTTVSQPVTVTVGIDDIVNFRNVRVYPNPTEGKLVIELGATPQSACTLEVMNMLGTSVLSRINLQNEATSIDMTSFAQGIYLVRIVQNDKIWVGRVIKQ